MLKISVTQEDGNSLRVHLYGQLTSEYVSELEKTLFGGKDETKKVTVDLVDVDFVDRQAMAFLCAATSRNVAIENIPSYVSRWIEQEGRCGSYHPERHPK